MALYSSAVVVKGFTNGCVYLVRHRKKSNTVCCIRDSNHGPLGFQASSATTIPTELTAVNRYCPVFKTVI